MTLFGESQASRAQTISEALLSNYNRNEQMKNILKMTYKAADFYFCTKFFLCENCAYYKGCYLQLFAVLRPDIRVTSFTSLSHVFCFNGVTVTKWSKLLKPHFHRNYQEKFVPGTFFSPNSVANLLLSKVLWRLGNLVWWHRTARDV